MRFKCFAGNKDRVVNSEMVGGYTLVSISDAYSDGGEKVTLQLFELNSPEFPKSSSGEFLERVARVALAHLEGGADLSARINVFAYDSSSKMFDGELEEI